MRVQKLLVLYFLCCLMELVTVEADYTFAIQLESYSNPTNTLANGSCCECCGVGAGSCGGNCSTVLWICLRNSSHPTDDPSCPVLLGSGSTEPRGINPAVQDGPWPGSVQLYLRITHNDGMDPQELIDAIFIELNVTANDPLTPLENFTGNFGVATLGIMFRVDCAINFYGSDCTIFCMDVNDTSGHYSCNEDGSISCLDGYLNESSNCLECIPADGCSPVGGFCIMPGECMCRDGYSGDNCSVFGTPSLGITVTPSRSAIAQTSTVPSISSTTPSDFVPAITSTTTPSDFVTAITPTTTPSDFVTAITPTTTPSDFVTAITSTTTPSDFVTAIMSTTTPSDFVTAITPTTTPSDTVITSTTTPSDFVTAITSTTTPFDFVPAITSTTTPSLTPVLPSQIPSLNTKDDDANLIPLIVGVSISGVVLFVLIIILVAFLVFLGNKKRKEKKKSLNVAKEHKGNFSQQIYRTYSQTDIEQTGVNKNGELQKAESTASLASGGVIENVHAESFPTIEELAMSKRSTLPDATVITFHEIASQSPDNIRHSDLYPYCETPSAQLSLADDGSDHDFFDSSIDLCNNHTVDSPPKWPYDNFELNELESFKP